MPSRNKWYESFWTEFSGTRGAGTGLLASCLTLLSLQSWHWRRSWRLIISECRFSKVECLETIFPNLPLSISFRRIYRITPLCTSVLLASNSIKPILWKLSIRLAIAAFLSLSPLLSWLHQPRILWSSFSSRWIFLRRGREIKIFSCIFHPFFHEIFLETCDLCNISGWRGEGFFIFHVVEAYCAPWKAFETRLGTFRGEIRLVEIWREFHLDKLFPRATSSIE